MILVKLRPNIDESSRIENRFCSVYINLDSVLLKLKCCHYQRVKWSQWITSAIRWCFWKFRISFDVCVLVFTQAESITAQPKIDKRKNKLRGIQWILHGLNQRDRTTQMNRLFGLFDHLLRSYQVIWLWVNRFQWKIVEFRKIERQITSKLLKKRTIFESNESVTQFECRIKYSNKNVNRKQGVATRTQTKTLPNRIWNNKLNLNCCFFLSSLHFWNSIFFVCVWCYNFVMDWLNSCFDLVCA